ncbi:NAD-dependent epimerase/dehydratase [Pseudopedobacter saltans DSM 12145]|uniref:NAD-dependent epimerase/dehydratase n=1 Tax=Pseudopedobacter saltans (strain ATCC 51119 / DSM 12145 / JCM 21818 / CCUG 39354 / LMG 10337 / NBRC 100064 / NCIMB 13643) TaxID=762903 RepID=F0S8W7_PSESL|nr:NAD-dependent epimerase/dehydratase family protein [Pseudopedobacter saltans]ADY53454.1 NAD-dependent epimerase/dehydratase [Pseudopedobacter saltans DSM 12145]
MISILGCGWLGLPLATKLNSNYKIKGSTTSEEKINLLKDNKIEAFNINIASPRSNLNEFLNTDILIINIPISSKTNLIENFNNLKNSIIESPIRKIIFISSTSVYTDGNKNVNESDNVDKNNANFKIEEILRSLPSHFKVTILRLAGLIGPNRHPGKFFAGKTEAIPNGLNPVNLIHLDDCINIISLIIEKKIWNETFNICTPHHPNRSEFYRKATEQYCGKTPIFVEKKGQWKTVDSSKVVKALNYNFKYDNLFEAMKNC